MVAGVTENNIKNNQPELVAFTIFEITKNEKLKKGVFRIPMYYAQNMPQNPIKHLRELENYNLDRMPAYFTLVEVSGGGQEPLISDQIDPKKIQNLNFKLTPSEPNLIKYYKQRLPPQNFINPTIPQEIKNFSYTDIPSFQIANESIFCKKKINDGFFLHLDYLIDLPRPIRYITCIHLIQDIETDLRNCFVISEITANSNQKIIEY